MHCVHASGHLVACDYNIGVCIRLQGFIDEPTREWGKEELPAISEGFTSNHIRERVLNLNKVSQHRGFSNMRL